MYSYPKKKFANSFFLDILGGSTQFTMWCDNVE